MRFLLAKYLKDIKEKPYYIFLRNTIVFSIAVLICFCLYKESGSIVNSAEKIWEENPTFYSSLITGFSGVIIALFTISKQRKLSREKNSLDFCSTYKHSSTIRDAWEEILKIRPKLKKNKKKHSLSIDTLDKEERKAVCLILNEWERCASGIKSKLYEDCFLYEIYAASVIGLYRDFFFFIESSQNRNPKYYCNLVWLCHAWSERKAKELEKGNMREVRIEQMQLRGNILENIKYIEENSC